jgi:hypothetical protein
MEENLKYKNVNTRIINMEYLKLNIKEEEELKWGM